MRDQLLSTKEAATRKGVPVQHVQDAINAGELPARREGQACFVHPDDLERWEPHPKTAAGADFTEGEALDYLRTQ